MASHDDPAWALTGHVRGEAPITIEASLANVIPIDSRVDSMGATDTDAEDVESAVQEHAEGKNDPDGDHSKSEEKDKKNGEKDAQIQTATTEETSSESAVGTIPIPKPDKFTGAAALAIPFAVPPGRLGLAPNLTLRYSSTQRNGWLGVGWDLDMGAIQRSTKNKGGVNYSAKDFVVVVNGSSSELVARTEWGSNYYGAKIEGAFSKFYFDGGTRISDGGFVQTITDGTKYYFGSTILSRQTDPADLTRVFKWCLDKVQDPNGNYTAIVHLRLNSHLNLIHLNVTS